MSNSLKLLLVTFWIRVVQSIKCAISIFKNEISFYPPSVKNLEAEFERRFQTKHALMFSNYTSALEAALYSLNIGVGSRVGTTALVIPSSYVPAEYLGAKLEFIDIDPSTLNLNALNLSSQKLDALIVTHYFGVPCDMEAIMKWANERKIPVIEDCSHAHGATYNGKPVGSFGRVGVFSLQGSKAVAAGEGGIAISNDSDLMYRMAAYGHQQSFTKFGIPPSKDVIPPFGYGRKMRGHPLGAVLANVDLEFLEMKNKIFESWVNELENLSHRLKTFKIARVPSNAKRGGYCQGVSFIFPSKDEAMQFMKSAKRNRVGVFTRDYRENVLSYEPQMDMKGQIPNASRAFDSVIYMGFQQFQLPWKWKGLRNALAAVRIAPNLDSASNERDLEQRKAV